jgi:uncharacterized protein (TIGR02996 family)
MNRQRRRLQLRQKPSTNKNGEMNHVADDAAFLAAILESPEDDGLRLIYADWLDEHGQPERAEFIRLQISLEQIERHDVPWDKRFQRIYKLLERFRSQWVVHLPEWAAEVVEFQRGFPTHVRLELDVFLASVDELARLMPLESAEIILHAPQEMERFARHPVLGGLRKLKLAPYGILDAGCMRALASSPHLARLVHLSLPCQEIGDAGVTYLARAHLPALRSLNLFDTKIGPEGLQALSSASFLNQLTELKLGSNALGSGHLGFLTSTSALQVLELDEVGLTDADMAILAQAPLSQLRELDLCENALSSDGLAAVAQAPGLTLLTKLRLFQNPLGEGAGEVLAKASFKVSYLELDEVGLGDVGLSALVRSDRLESLTFLTVSENGLTAASARMLAQTPHLGQLRHLDLSENPLGSDGALAVLAAPSLPSLQHLDLDNTGMEAAPSHSLPPTRKPLGCLRVAKNLIAGPLAECLFCRPELAELKNLFVFENPLGADGMEAIAGSPALGNLDWLHASETSLGPAGARALAASTTLRCLRHLVLNDCRLGNEGVAALAGSPLLTSVEQLDLHRNDIQAPGMTALAASPYFQQLRSLSLFDNPLGDAGATALAQAVWLDRITSLSLGYCGLGAGAVRALASVPLPGLGKLTHLGLIGNTPELVAALFELPELIGAAVSLS